MKKINLQSTTTAEKLALLSEGYNKLFEAYEALVLEKQEKLIAGENITINEETNIISASSGGIVIYNNASGANTIENIILTAGKKYEFYCSVFMVMHNPTVYSGIQIVKLKYTEARVIGIFSVATVDSYYFDSIIYDATLSLVSTASQFGMPAPLIYKIIELEE